MKRRGEWQSLTSVTQPRHPLPRLAGRFTHSCGTFGDCRHPRLAVPAGLLRGGGLGKIQLFDHFVGAFEAHV